MIVEEKDLKYAGSDGIPHARGGDVERKTGSWRVYKPTVEPEACIACRMCWVSCPDSAISLDENNFPTIHYELCKGCLICEETCPTDAITSARDDHAP